MSASASPIRADGVASSMSPVPSAVRRASNTAPSTSSTTSVRWAPMSMTSSGRDRSAPAARATARALGTVSTLRGRSTSTAVRAWAR
ncbi:hypothetical protein BZZ08_04529 [Streptomyces sp. MH60]|nr:hypothetical protein BZZ08_04529 [Streptomyces sp. MH60]